jgi:PAS domain S-box-containing protein
MRPDQERGAEDEDRGRPPAAAPGDDRRAAARARREAAARARREAAEHLRLAQEAGGVATWWADERTGRLHASPQFARLWGVPAGSELTTAQQLELIHPADRDRVIAAYAAALAGRTRIYKVDYRVVWPDGGCVWLAARGEPVRDDSGEVLGVRGVTFDVTELKTARIALEDSERRFGEIADAAPMVVWLADSNRNVIWFNRAWVEFTGVPMERHLGFGWMEAIHPEDQERTLAIYLDAFDRRGSYRMEYRLRRHDGVWRWMDECGRPHWSADSRFSGFVGSAADVTEKKAAVDALRESENRFRAFAQAGQDVIWIADPVSGRLTYLNPQFERMYGVPRQIIYDDPDYVLNHVHPDDRRTVADAYDALHRGEAVDFEYRWTRPDGEERILDDNAFPVLDDEGKPCWIGGRVRDITDRRRAEQALAEKEALFRGFAEATDDMVAMFDPEMTRATYVNSAFERVWGGDAEAFRQSFDYWRQVVHPDDAHVVEEGAQILRSGRPYKIKMRVILPTDGSMHWVEDRAFPVRDEAGRVKAIGSIMRDITDAVAAQEALEQRVAERTEELEASLEERRKTEAALAQAQRLETVGRLTGGVAHDFNNLLTVIIGALDMILRRPEQTDRVASLGQAALEAGRRGERLTRQLLAFSRRQPMRLETVALRTLILGFEPMLRGVVGEDTPLAVEVADDLGWVRIDPVQFEAALLNLVVNANDAIGPEGSVRVVAERVRLREGEAPDAPAGEYGRVAVIDNGAGMTPEVAAHAFEPFFTTKGVGEGTGLGLAQVYGFIRQSGGGVTLKTAPGRGTTIALHVPLCEAPVETEAPAPLEERPLEMACHVLLVEDDPGVRAVAAGLLVDLGCEVLTASDGPSALKLLEANPDVHLLLSDVVMPGGMSGVDLAEAATNLRPDLKVLLSTGYASDRLEVAGNRWPVLLKPYQADELVAAVRNARA